MLHGKQYETVTLLRRIVIAATISVAVAAAFAFIALSVNGNSMQPIGGMMDRTMMMQGNSGMIQMQQTPQDVMILFESEAEVPSGNQTEIVLKVLDKRTNATVQGGSDVIIGIEKGLPMTTMDMMGNSMFRANERGNGTYSFTFTPKSEGYYTIHVHVIPQGKQMHSMMENHVDFIIISK